MTPTMRVPQQIYGKLGEVVLFNQLAIKIEMDNVPNVEYFKWLDQMRVEIGDRVPGAKIVEKVHARVTPPLNVAIYYDTPDYRILPTGALLRTSCNRITHAFCAFKMTQDEYSVRNDHRYVFAGDEKLTIQTDPDSEAAVLIVRRLLARKDIIHPGTYLQQNLGIPPTELDPAIRLEDYRFTFFVWLDGKDALRCSVDRFEVSNLRLAASDREKKPVSEVELAIYPRIDPEVAKSERVVELIRVLGEALCDRFGVSITNEIKYQRSARALGLWQMSSSS